MATIPVDLALETLASLVAQEFRLLGGLRGAVAQLGEDLESMRAFLQDAQNQSQSNQSFKTWVKQVRDVAYDAEDAVDEFFLTLTLPSGRGFTHSLLNFFRSISGWRAQHRLAVQIQSIKLRIDNISRKKEAFSIQGPSSSNSTTHVGFDPRRSALYIDEADVVGIENPRSTLIEWLVNGKEKLTCVSVVGMGGVGKTTLVKKVFDSHIVRTWFDCQSRVTVSKSFTFLELLQVIFKGFMEEIKDPAYKDIERMSEPQLVEALRNYLQQKRYVVVLDDIWSIDAWETVRVALPDCNCKSRIIVTTRFIEVAESMETAGHIYQLDPLQEKEAWSLFCSKTFRGDHGGVCPPELEGLSRAFLKKCGGLPLAIVAIGGLLSKKSKVLSEWKKVLDSLAAEITADGKLNNLEKILLLSYDDLPYHIKTCYLYMSAFPEDYEIKRMKLVRLWVTERFVEEKQGLTLEQVAESYLNELVNRSLIQVVTMDHFNRIYTCQLHDIMREVLLERSRKDSLIISMNQTNVLRNENVRRMSVLDNFENLPLYMQFKKVRTLITFNSMGTSSSNSVRSSFQGFRLLRVLELENAPLVQFPMSLVKLIFLRYLSLRQTSITKIPDSIRKLKNLEILDLKFSLVSSMPSGILELKRLQQLRCYGYSSYSSYYIPDSRGMAVPTGIGKLTSLQKLSSVEVDNEGKLVRELGKLTQLRRLSILKLREQHVADLCYTLERLKNLTGLYMDSNNMDEVLQLNCEICPPEFLQRLYVKCRLPALPRWITSLQYLEKLVLQNSHMEEDPLEALQALPSLVVLELRVAYVGKELQCNNANGYPRLKRLCVHVLKNLKLMKVAEGAMPELRELVIIDCSELETVPLGIEHLKNLKTLYLWRMSLSFLQKMESPDGDDFWRVQHIPVITGI